MKRKTITRSQKDKTLKGDVMLRFDFWGMKTKEYFYMPLDICKHIYKHT